MIESHIKSMSIISDYRITHKEYVYAYVYDGIESHIKIMSILMFFTSDDIITHKEQVYHA